ncbi:hypothetical protein TgHK011_000163 [Trichoderma gracile]|nr:hypothetical protein TgHK011_000163 [Trichoderma gracile]
MHERIALLMMTNILWLRHLFDRLHSRISTFRESHSPQPDKALVIDSYGRRHADMPSIQEEKSSLRPSRPDGDAARQQLGSKDSTARQGRRDASRNTDVPSEEDVQAQEMEHQRYGEAQPQLVPTDVIETMLHTAKGRNKDGLDSA